MEQYVQIDINSNLELKCFNFDALLRLIDARIQTRCNSNDFYKHLFLSMLLDVQEGNVYSKYFDWGIEKQT